MRVYFNQFVSTLVPSLADCSNAVRAYIDDNCLSGRDFYDEDGSNELLAALVGVRHPFRGGEVLDDSGTVIAVVSYNGRVWKPKWNDYTECWIGSDDILYDPYETPVASL